jgi:hypothetical protein
MEQRCQEEYMEANCPNDTNRIKVIKPSTQPGYQIRTDQETTDQHRQYVPMQK